MSFSSPPTVRAAALLALWAGVTLLGGVPAGGEVPEPDHTLYMPAGAPHSYRVIEAPFEFLCVVPNRPDTIRILDESTGAPED